MSAEHAHLPPGVESQLVVTMFAAPGTPVLTVVSADELAERQHRRVTSVPVT